MLAYIHVQSVSIPRGPRGVGKIIVFTRLRGGYGAFSVSPSQLHAVLQYVETQQAHHRTRTFQEEYRELLRKHGVDFDERPARNANDAGGACQAGMFGIDNERTLN